ncbi:MAG TPA: hypothetical protein DDW81_13190 [Cryomorphaceae bacterium]|nr:hypothetical protein [Owenweeksia sp.]HBF21048.1 hypothetical protein [Cryomorphaceae bacterium]HCQ16694.1 hypothetical protein [Cryomorphaceae bacterium]
MLMLAVSIATATAHGGEEKKEEVQMEYLSNQVIALLTYPDFILGKMGDHHATIHFKVDEKGSLSVQSVETNTLGLAQHIEKLLHNKHVYTDSSLFAKSYSLKVSFL